MHSTPGQRPVQRPCPYPHLQATFAPVTPSAAGEACRVTRRGSWHRGVSTAGFGMRPSWKPLLRKPSKTGSSMPSDARRRRRRDELVKGAVVLRCRKRCQKTRLVRTRRFQAHQPIGTFGHLQRTSESSQIMSLPICHRPLRPVRGMLPRRTAPGQMHHFRSASLKCL